MLSTRDPTQNKVHTHTEIDGLEKHTSCKWRPKESRSSNTNIRKKRDFEIKAVKKDKEGHYIMIKGSTQENITIIHMNMHPI